MIRANWTNVKHNQTVVGVDTSYDITICTIDHQSVEERRSPLHTRIEHPVRVTRNILYFDSLDSLSFTDYDSILLSVAEKGLSGAFFVNRRQCGQMEVALLLRGKLLGYSETKFSKDYICDVSLISSPPFPYLYRGVYSIGVRKLLWRER